MNLSAETRQILDQVDLLTGKPVTLVPDPKLPNLATVMMAQGSAAAHLLRYRPDAPSVDYHIAYQSCFVLRLYENPAKHRFGFAGNESGQAAVENMLFGQYGTLKAYHLPEDEKQKVTSMILGGLLTQLRSMPVGMRIDMWLRENCPGLRVGQAQSIAVQQAQSAQALSPQARTMTPPSVFSASAAMNAGYAMFCDRLLGQQSYGIPYRAIGMGDRGQVLLDIWDRVPAAPTHDRELVDVWGNELGLSDWFGWVPISSTLAT